MKRSLVNFAFMLVLLALIAIVIEPYIPIESNDFPGYYAAAKHFCDGTGTYPYALHLELGKAGYGLNEPPFIMAIFAPLAFLPYAAAKFVWDCVMLSLVAGATIILANTAKLTPRQTLALMTLVVVTGPVFEIIKVSKPSPLLFFGLACSLASLQKKQDFKAGAWITMCLLKPQEILPFMVFALGGMRIRFLAGVAAMVAILMLLSFPIFGVDGYVYWINRLVYIGAHTEFAGTDSMPTLYGQLVRSSVLPVPVATKICSGIFAVALIGLGVLGFKQKQAEKWWQIGAVIVLAMASLLPYIYAYDLVIVVPGMCYLLQSLYRAKRKILIGCVFLALTTFLNLIYAVLFYYPLTSINFHFLALLLVTVVCFLSAREIIDDARETAVV